MRKQSLTEGRNAHWTMYAAENGKSGVNKGLIIVSMLTPASGYGAQAQRVFEYKPMQARQGCVHKYVMAISQTGGVMVQFMLGAIQNA